MLIQIHILQNYAPANLNRDDTGSPKDAVFGGVRRGRISSQCLKRSIRCSQTFEDAFRKDGLIASRTKLLAKLLAEELDQLQANDEEKKAVLLRVPEIGRESTKKKDKENDQGEEEKVEETPQEEDVANLKGKQLIFISPDELHGMADKLLKIYRRLGAKEWNKTKIDVITKELGGTVPRSVDIAMFGRMTTSSAFEDVDASVQVAHAISTNALAEEFDYYTAVDDLSGESGAGMIGDVEFNSSTYYKYLNIHWEQLVENLGGDQNVARKAVLTLLEAAATTHPTGKQNSFAAFNLPDLIIVETSAVNLPVSYANAFLKPVHQNAEHSLMENSVAALQYYIEKISGKYSLSLLRAFLSVEDGIQLAGKECHSLEDLKMWLADQLQ